MRTLAALIALGALASACGEAPLSEAAVRGRAVFLQHSKPLCGTCHVLADAQTAGPLGPDLDQLRPDRDRVIRSVTQGVGVMPSQRGILTDQQIQDVADYVVEAAGR